MVCILLFSNNIFLVFLSGYKITASLLVLQQSPWFFISFETRLRLNKPYRLHLLANTLSTSHMSSNRVACFIRFNPGVLYCISPAKYAAAFFRISRSCSARCNSLRRRLLSALRSEALDCELIRLSEW